MPKRKSSWIVILLMLLLSLATMTSAQEVTRPDPVRGGQLYDNWFVNLSTLPPEGDHPLWNSQEYDSRSGTVTWRCVTCHGWDYKGLDGAFNSQSAFYTGFPGTLEAVGLANETIAAWLDGSKNPNHDFSELIERDALGDLIAFLRTKQIDLALIVDYQTNASLGLRRDGQDLYNLDCMHCHGLDGSALNFGDASAPEFIADIALYDPWEFIHKVRFGGFFSDDHDFESREWSIQNLADVLAYAQSLPPGNTSSEAENDSTDDVPAIDFSGQGDLRPVVVASFAIVLVILIGLGWSYFTNR